MNIEGLPDYRYRVPVEADDELDGENPESHDNDMPADMAEVEDGN